MKPIGLYGCYCHPFESWDECKKFNKQKVNVGDIVKHRCNGKVGEVLKAEGKWIYYKEHGLEHVSNVIIQTKS